MRFEGLRLWGRMVHDDVHRDARRQSAMRIALFRVGPFLQEKVCGVATWISISLAAAAALSAAFVPVYLCLGARVDPDFGGAVSFSALFWDSFLTFEILPIFTENGRPLYMNLVQSSLGPADSYTVFWAPILLEMALGLVVNGCTLAEITEVALRPTNPLWIAPKAVVRFGRRNEKGVPLNDGLRFSYWIRYPEQKWLYSPTLSLYLQPDSSFRGLETQGYPRWQRKIDYNIARGTRTLFIGFGDEKSKGDLLLEILTKWLACSRPGESTVVYDSKEHRMVAYHPSEEDRKVFSTYHLALYIWGSTDSGYQVAKTKRRNYYLNDLLFSYDYKDIEVYDKERTKVEAYHYANVWRLLHHMDKKTVIMASSDQDDDYKGDFDSRRQSLFSPPEDDGWEEFVRYFEYVGYDMKNMVMRSIQAEDAPSIAGIMKRAQDALEDPSMYLINTERLVRKRIDRGALGEVIEVDGVVVAFSIYRNPPADQLERSLGHRPDIPLDEYGRVVVVGSIAVDPRYQRMGLGSRLLVRIEEVARERGCHYLMTTVDPDNKASMGNFERQGYKVVATISAYSSVGDNFIFDTEPSKTKTTRNLRRNILKRDIS